MGSQPDASPTVALDRESIEYTIHHVFLPPMLPDSDDTNARLEKALLQHVHSALMAFQELHVGSGSAGLQGVARCILMVQRMISMTRDGALDPGLLNKKLGEMQTDDVLAVLIKKQNAGLLVTRREDVVYFEAFELLARVEDVTKTEGRLRRLFPGRSAAVSVNHLGDNTFRAPLVDALAKMDSDPAPELLTNYRWEKYMQTVETAHPQLVTEMLMGFIRGVGENASVTDLEPARILKNVREEVMGETQTPWRRSALWLLLRISMQITMERSVQQCPAREIYKEFIIFFLCQTLRQAITLDLPHHRLFTMLSKISRRILKLGLSEAPWLGAADEILRETRLVLERFWAGAQDEDGRSLDFSALESLDFAADTDLTLKTLRPHLKDFATGIPLSSSEDTSEAGDHAPCMNDAQSLPHTEFHTEDKQLLVYELADFESWVELHLKNHITIRPDADSAWASNAVPGSNGVLPQQCIADYGNFTQEDHSERTSQNTNTMPDFGFPVARELKSDSLHDLPNSPGKANRMNSKADDDTWFRIVDNSFALRFMEQPGNSPAKTEQPGTPVELCYRCKMINPLASGFNFCVDLAGLGTTAKTCRLCQMLRRSFKKIGLPPKIGTITIYRDGTNLKVDYNSQPVLRICTKSESHDFKDIQVGPRSLSGSGTGRKHDFSLMRAWLAECDGTHSRFGCNTRRHSGAQFLPTRVLDLECWGDEGLVRLHCTKELDSYEYVALSHCWGAPSEEEWESVCTHSQNLQKRLQHIAFEDLPRTFQDAITATRKLGKRYLWIDSLCIIQRDERDWEKESALMESVFSSAYCTISATCARSFSDGFLRSRPPADSIPVPNAPEGAGPFWLSETVDNFHADVEDGPVNRRGWVLQERVLSRRTIYFTANQFYFECGAGVRCETMTWLWNPRAALLGDPQFPDAILKRDPADRIAPLQMLFESYTGMNLSVATDRPVAISGLERRLASGFEGATAYGVLERYIHRSLLWQRTGKSALERIKYPGTRRSIPSWSWMAYDGAIQYLDVPKEGVEWNNFISFAPARNIIAAGPGASPPCTNELKVGVSALRTAEVLKDRWSVTLDDPLAADWEELACVVIGRCTTSTGEVELYVLFVRSIFMDGYQRVGAGRIEERHLAAKEPIAGRIV